MLKNDSEIDFGDYQESDMKAIQSTIFNEYNDIISSSNNSGKIRWI